MRLLIFVALLSAAGCGSATDPDTSIVAPPQSQGTVELVEEEGFVLGEDSYPEGAVSGGAMLVEIMDLDVDLEGDIYVLDAQFKKIAVFDEGGNFDRVIVGGIGQGPGEFHLPTTLSVARDRRVAVFDYGQNRVTIFDGETGEYVNTLLDVPRTRSIKLIEESIFGTYYPVRDYGIWRSSTENADSRQEFMAIGDRQREFYPRGEIAKIGNGPEDTFIVASMRPGIWHESTDGFHQAVGVELYPGRSAFTLPLYENPNAPAETIGIGYIEPGLVAIVYKEFNENVTAADLQRPTDNRLIRGFSLAVYEAEGDYIGSIGLPTTNLSAFTTIPGTDEILFTRYEPFPQVVRARVSVTR